MTSEVRKKIKEKIKDIEGRGYTDKEFNLYLSGLLIGLRIAEAISQDERYAILDEYGK